MCAINCAFCWVCGFSSIFSDVISFVCKWNTCGIIVQHYMQCNKYPTKTYWITDCSTFLFFFFHKITPRRMHFAANTIHKTRTKEQEQNKATEKKRIQEKSLQANVHRPMCVYFKLLIIKIVNFENVPVDVWLMTFCNSISRFSRRIWFLSLCVCFFVFLFVFVCCCGLPSFCIVK